MSYPPKKIDTMKKAAILIIMAVAILSCATTKNMNQDKLYNTTWELNYITGPRIAFDGLYPNKKPVITFNKATQKVEGNNSCNGYIAPFTVEGDSIHFGQAGPTTLMYCGEGEQVFLKTIQQINTFQFNAENELVLLMDGIPAMRFHKKQ